MGAESSAMSMRPQSPFRFPPTHALTALERHLWESLAALAVAAAALETTPTPEARRRYRTALAHSTRAMDAAQAVLAEWRTATGQ